MSNGFDLEDDPSWSPPEPRGSIVQATTIPGTKLPPPRRPYVMAITPEDEELGTSWQCPNCRSERLLARPPEWRLGLRVMHECDGCGLAWRLTAEAMKGGDTTPYALEMSDVGVAAMERAFAVYDLCTSAEPSFRLLSTGPNELGATWTADSIPRTTIVRPLSIDSDQLALCLRDLLVSSAVQLGALSDLAA